MLPRAAPRTKAGACTLQSSLRCLRTSDRLVLRGVMKIRKNQPPPGDAGPALQEPAICLPRGAHAAPGCPEAPSRRLHPGVLPPLPAHLGSSCSPWIVFHNFCFLGCCSHIGSSRFFGGCIVLGLSQSCVLMPTRFDALSDFRIVLICRKHFE